MHKGNKSYLPVKPCKVCGREMTWRKAWANTWDQVQHCSEACRRRRSHPSEPSKSGAR